MKNISYNIHAKLLYVYTQPLCHKQDTTQGQFLIHDKYTFLHS